MHPQPYVPNPYIMYRHDPPPNTFNQPLHQPLPPTDGEIHVEPTGGAYTNPGRPVGGAYTNPGRPIRGGRQLSPEAKAKALVNLQKARAAKAAKKALKKA